MGKPTAKAVFDFLWGKRILRDAAAMCVVSPLEAKDAAAVGVNLSRIHPLPAAIDPDQYANLACRGAFASLWNIQNRRIVLFLGRLHWIKGADILIEALSRIDLPDVHLVIAGPDDGAEQHLRSLVNLKGLEQRVTFTGFLDGTEKANALRDSSVVVIPSRREGFPLTVLEALATQTPVILTSACDLGTWIHAQPGLISFRSEDAEDLAQKLMGILCAPPDPKAMAETRDFVLKEFSSDAIAARAERVYRSVRL
jgi:glycosyltransferase involved in cell wall biosynthesis